MQELLDKIGININITFSLIFLGLIWVRVLAMGIVIPFLFGKPVPRNVLVGMSFILALFAFPALAPKTPPDLTGSLLGLFMLFLKEAYYGFLFGLAMGSIFYGFQAAGAMIDNQRGVSIARLLIPQLGEQGSLVGNLLFQMSVVIFLTMGGHLAFLDAFFQSFISLPLLEFPVSGTEMFPLMALFVEITGEVLYISVQLAAPVIIAIFIADIILGIANRVAPQINVWELGFNVKGYVGVLLLFVAITMIGEQFQRYSTKSTEYVPRIIKVLKTPPKAVDPEIPIPEDGVQSLEEGTPRVKTLP